MTWSPMLGPCPPHSHNFTRTPVCLSGSHGARGLLLRLAPGTGDSLLRTPVPEPPVGAGLRLGAEAQCGAVCAQLAHGHKPAPHTLRPGRPGPSPGRAPGTWPATRPGLRQVGPQAGPRAGLVRPSPQGPASWGSHGWADEPREVLREPDTTPAGAATPPERRKADLHLPAGSGSPAEQGNGRPPPPPGLLFHFKPTWKEHGLPRQSQLTRQWSGEKQRSAPWKRNPQTQKSAHNRVSGRRGTLAPAESTWTEDGEREARELEHLVSSLGEAGPLCPRPCRHLDAAAIR